jgi:hypothetical protein
MTDDGDGKNVLMCLGPVGPPQTHNIQYSISNIQYSTTNNTQYLTSNHLHPNNPLPQPHNPREKEKGCRSTL